MLQHLCKAVMQTMATQANADLVLEKTKAILADVLVEVAFDDLRRDRCTFVDDNSLYEFVRGADGEASFYSLATMIREMKHYQVDRVSSSAGRLSLREFAALVYPRQSKELEAIAMTSSDDEARNVIYVTRRSCPCPVCGIRCQRDADCAGCPSIMCPMCGTSFDCFVVVSDREAGYEGSFSATDAMQLQRFLDFAACTATEQERDRREVWSFTDGGRQLSEAFRHLAGGCHSISANALQTLFWQHGHTVSDEAFDLFWHRYTGRPIQHNLDAMSFDDFRRQMCPVERSL